MITIKFLGKKGKPIGGKTRGGFCFFVYLFIFVFLLQVFLLRTNQKLNKKYITLLLGKKKIELPGRTPKDLNS